MLDQTPTLADLQKYDVNRPGAVEVVRQALYDFQLYPTAGQTSFTFFANPIGSGITSSPGGVVGSAKSRGDTNMELAGQLPAPKSFIAESIEVYFWPGSSAAANTFTIATPTDFIAAAAAAATADLDDCNAVLNAGALRFFIGSKEYLFETPLVRFPPKCYLGADLAVASNSATTAEIALVLARSMGRPYYLEPPLTLRATQNFQVTIEFPGVIATPSGFNARIGVVIDGYLFRNSQ